MGRLVELSRVMEGKGLGAAVKVIKSGRAHLGCII